jgi:guanyl-specific ribonuclease Sa
VVSFLAALHKREAVRLGKRTVKSVIALYLIVILLGFNTISCSNRQDYDSANERINADEFFLDTYEDTGYLFDRNEEYISVLSEFDSGEVDFYSDEFILVLEDFIYDEYSEYIDGVYVSVLSPEEYNEALLVFDSGQQLNINKIIKNVAIGAGSIIVTSILLPALAPGLVPRMAIIITNIVRDAFIGAAFDAGLTGVVEYIKSGDTKSALYGAMEGGAEGFMWGAIVSSAVHSFAEIRLLKQSQQLDERLVSFSDNTDDIQSVKKNNNSIHQKTSNSTTAGVAGKVPQDADDVLEIILDNGKRPKGYTKWGKRWINRESRLPTHDVNDNLITYKEYDVHPLPFGSRGRERIVIGSNGTYYYTSDHYTSFTQIYSKSQKSYNGGYYGGLRTEIKASGQQNWSKEVHHMPSNASYPAEINKTAKPELGERGKEFNSNSGPAIIMDYDDHIKTASHTQTPGYLEYQQKQRELMREGKPEEAFQMDSDDIRKLFGNKYDYAIARARDHMRWLRELGYWDLN